MASLDLKIVGADMLDGTGAPARRADVGVLRDRIVEVGDLSTAPAHTTLDLSRPPTNSRTPLPPHSQTHTPTHVLSSSSSSPPLLLTPGFIDVHSHSDVYLLVEPSAQSKIHQGVTTEVVGNCGASAVPLVEGSRLPSDWADKPLPGTWASVAEYRELFELVRPAVNAVLLVGHNTLRGGVVGFDNRPAQLSELRRMRRILDRALDEGARGFSTGLIYPPGMFTPAGEVVDLAKVVARREGIYTSHIRNEGDRLLAAIEEALDVGRCAGVRVQVSHLKSQGRRSQARSEQSVKLIRDAREHGIDVAADRYPYTASNTSLDIVLPDWAHEGGNDALMRRLADPATRVRLRDDMDRARMGAGWDGITVASTTHRDTKPFQGMKLTDVAGALGMSPAEALLHVIEKDELRTSAFFDSMSGENMRRVLREPYVMIGSDASLRALSGPLGDDFPHPRAFGAFPRFLRMALDGLVPLAEAVRKMTSLPAAQFRLADRGIVAPGKAADLVVLDPARVRDRASFSNPRQLPDGITHVIVNGVLTVRDGEPTGDRAGRVL